MDVAIQNCVIDTRDVSGPIFEMTDELASEMEEAGVTKIVFDGLVLDKAVDTGALADLLRSEKGEVRLDVCRCRNHFVVRREDGRRTAFEEVSCIMSR